METYFTTLFIQSTQQQSTNKIYLH